MLFNAGLYDPETKSLDVQRWLRAEAYDELVANARALGANAVIAMRYESNEIMDGVTEVLAYGTAVVVEEA